jgi:hypothetical protein
MAFFPSLANATAVVRGGHGDAAGFQGLVDASL